MKIGVRVWVLIIFLILSVLAISPSFKSAAVVSSIGKDNYFQGLGTGEIIKSLNGQTISNKDSYYSVLSSIDFASSEDTKITLVTNKDTYLAFTNSSPDIIVADSARSKINLGLDLQGGARALVQADRPITDNELQDLITISRNRFNVYGLRDIQIKPVTDLSGGKYMLVEVAGATPADLEELISQQGKFKANVGNVTVFEGGKKDVSGVCRNDAKCSGIVSCDPSQSGYSCQFRFTIYLTDEAAKRHADITKNVSIDSSGQYLSDKLYLYVDDQEVDSLYISVDLRGQQTTQISIQGPGTGATQADALKSAQENMRKLQTVLLTGSLPYKLKIVKLDTISATLGKDFLSLILLAGFSSIIIVSIIIFIRYRKFKESLAILFTSFSELIIILGAAALFRWNLDLPSIAGILATIGTGVDSQIVILDEARKSISVSAIERMKRALFIVFSSFFTAVVAMLPLISAGAGLFKGFALTTIAGITIGVLISRPAFAEIIRKIEEN